MSAVIASRGGHCWLYSGYELIKSIIEMRDFCIREKTVGVLFMSAVIIEVVIYCLELVHYSVT